MSLTQIKHIDDSLSSRDSATYYEPVLPVAEVVALEQRIASEGTSLKELMARAGTALTQCILDWWNNAEANSALGNESPNNKDTDIEISVSSNINSTVQPKAVIFTGSGNNGGDGWVVANLLAKQNWNITVVCSKPAEELKAEPARETALEIIAGWNNLSTEKGSAKHSSAESTSITKKAPTILVSPSKEQLEKELSEAQVVVDGILGTGFSGSTIREPYASWVRLSNQEKDARKSALCTDYALGSSENTRESMTPLLTIAADVPSGLSADTGSVADPCFIADATVTMLVYKPGLILPESQQWTGSLILAPLV